MQFYKQIFFDFDSTLSPLEGIDVIAQILEREGIEEITRACMDGKLNVREAFEKRIEALAVKRHQLEALGSIYLSNMSPGALELLDILKFLDKEIHIVSGGFAVALRVVCERLKLEHLSALELDFSKGEIGLCMESELIEKDGKAKIVQSVKKGPCTFIGDGFTDYQTQAVVEKLIPYAGVVYRPWMDEVRKDCEIYAGENLLGLLPMLVDKDEFERCYWRFGSLISDAADHYLEGVINPLDGNHREFIAGFRNRSFLIPGPTQVDPAHARVSFPAIGHRSPSFEKLYARCQSLLQKLLGTDDEILTFNSSATGVMEALCASLPRESKVLSLQSGAFAQRFAQVAVRLGLNVSVIAAKSGSSVKVSELESVLKEQSFDAIFITHSETSNGTLQDVDGLTSKIRELAPDSLILVDGVSSATQIPVDTSGLDAYFFGTQKCLALPPGLAFCTVSPRLAQYAAEKPSRSFYFDLGKTVKSHRAGNVASTPAIDLFEKLQFQLAFLCESKEERFKACQCLAQMVWSFCEKEGLEIYAQAGDRSWTVTSIKIPQGLDDFWSSCREAGLEFANGYGDLKGLHFRIGHMGNVDGEMLERTLTRLKGIINGK